MAPNRPRGRARDPWLDNAKMALVTLVVVGHSWNIVPSDGLTEHLYYFLYAWHMPAFVLITGYLCRSFAYSPERMWQLVRTVAVPYVVFEALLAAFRIYVGHERLETLFLDPHWPLWYLCALFFWRLATPFFKAIPAAVLVAVVISLLGGLVTSDVFCVGRILGFLPFFVLGLCTTPERLEWLRGTAPKVLAVVGFAGVWTLTAYTTIWADPDFLYYRMSYAEMGVGDVRGIVTRLAVIAVGLVGALAFLALVPRRGGWFSRMGQWTLIVYLCHGFVVKGVEYTAYPDWAVEHVTLAFLVTTLGAVGVALALASPPVARWLDVLADPFGRAERRVDAAVEVAAVTAAPPPEPVLVAAGQAQEAAG